MPDDQVDLVAGDFNGVAHRRTTNANISIIEEAFADCDLPMPHGPTPLWGPGAVPGTWSNVCGFFSSLRTQMCVGEYGNMVPHEALGIRQTDQSCHHEVWLHMDFVEQHEGHVHRERHERRLLLKERSASYKYNDKRYKASEDASDHSLSS